MFKSSEDIQTTHTHLTVPTQYFTTFTSLGANDRTATDDSIPIWRAVAGLGHIPTHYQSNGPPWTGFQLTGQAVMAHITGVIRSLQTAIHGQRLQHRIFMLNANDISTIRLPSR